MGESKPLIDLNKLRDGRTGSKGWVIAFVCLASQAMVCKGLIYGITGLTLHYLASNTNSTIDQLSNMISVRAVGTGFGALAFSIVKSKANDAKIVTSSGIALLALGSITLSTPFIRSLTLLVVLQILTGFSMGYSQSGLVSLFLTSWGEARSRPYVQLNHFMFSVGGIVTPLLAKPFLEMASLHENVITTCPGHETATQSSYYFNHTLSTAEYAAPGPVSWPYFIIGMYTVVISILFCILAACKIEEKLYEHDDGRIETRPEKSMKEVWKFSIFVVMYSAFCMSTYVVYRTYIYSAVVCCLKMAVSDAAMLNFLFWVGFAIGRGSAVVTSWYFKPSTIIISDLVGTTSAMIMMSVWGETSVTVMWIGTFVHGFSIASLLPSAVSWSSEVTNMSGKYLSLFYFGGNVGAAVLSRVGGAVYQSSSFSVIYLVTGISFATAACFAFMNVLKPDLINNQ